MLVELSGLSLLALNLTLLKRTSWLLVLQASTQKLQTTGAVTFAKYAIQVALQYEFDNSRDSHQFHDRVYTTRRVQPG